MSAPMPFGARRRLTEAEKVQLSPGLIAALDVAGAAPVIVARPSVPALISILWRWRPPVMVLGSRIYWPGALSDFSQSRLMPVLQHELQHVLEFATGDLTRWGYILSPRNWIYSYRITPAARWSDYGAEQRASIVQAYWTAERQGQGAIYRALIPWARESRDEAGVCGGKTSSTPLDPEALRG